MRLFLIALMLALTPMYLEASAPRDYSQELTTQERQDIRYIVSTLSEKPLPKLMFSASSLEAAGDRIEHVHPLRFLECVFSDEQMLAGVHNIRHKGWVWGRFIGGTKRSLKEEYAQGNVTEVQVIELAERVNIPSESLTQAMNQQDWDGFVNVLLVQVPRTQGHDRYDM